MKKCPQCSAVYEGNVIYCLNDGTALGEESFSLPSDDSIEAETVIRRDPIVVDWSANAEEEGAVVTPSQPPRPQISTPVENVVIVPAVSAAKANRNYALFLVIGLLIGGGLVLATLWMSKNFYGNKESGGVKVNVNTNAAPRQATTTEAEKPKIVRETPNRDESVSTETVNQHAEPNEAVEGRTNGRVIAVNARVRFAPDKDAPVVDTLPMNDRLEIIRRQNSNSPWYQVECEHGATGWMHGDTIEFTQ